MDDNVDVLARLRTRSEAMRQDLAVNPLKTMTLSPASIQAWIELLEAAQAEITKLRIRSAGEDGPP